MKLQQRTGGPYNKIIKENGGPQIEFSNSHIAPCTCTYMSYVYVHQGAKNCSDNIYIFSLFNFHRIDVRYNVVICMNITHVGSYNFYICVSCTGVICLESYFFFFFFLIFSPEKNPSRTCFTSEYFFRNYLFA